jgi:hypothetical protein
MYVCIMHQCFNVGTSYGSWLGLTIPTLGWDVTLSLLGGIIKIVFGLRTW